MDIRQLTGYYTHRIFIDNPIPVDDFNRIKFAEVNLIFTCKIGCTLTKECYYFRLNLALQIKKSWIYLMEQSKNIGDRYTFEFIARGRPNTQSSDYVYSYNGSVSYFWENALDQRFSLTGTILRVQDHDWRPNC